MFLIFKKREIIYYLSDVILPKEVFIQIKSICRIYLHTSIFLIHEIGHKSDKYNITIFTTTRGPLRSFVKFPFIILMKSIP